MGFHAFYASAGKKSEKDAVDLFKKALSMGITHFDTAQFYGNKYNALFFDPCNVNACALCGQC